MRIGYFIPGWPPDKVPNGIAATLGILSSALEKLGSEVSFLTPFVLDKDPDNRVTVIRSKAPSLIERALSRLDSGGTLHRATAHTILEHLKMLLSQKTIDIFEMEETHGWVGTVAKHLPIPVVTRLHGPWFSQTAILSHKRTSKSDSKRIKREGLAIRSAFAITAPSKAVLNSAEEFYGGFSGLSKIIPNPMPLSASVWNYNECDKSTILFVGRFDHLKGGDTVIKAFSELHRIRPNLRLIFVGPDFGVKVHNGDQLLFSEYVRQQVSSEAASQINYLGTLPRSQINALRTKAALTIVASRFETFPNVVSEAMATGCPIIATAVGGIPEMLDDRRNGILIGADDSLELASACLALIDNPEQAQQLAAQARIDCSTKFDPITIAKQQLEFYREVIQKFHRQIRVGSRN
jgi:glycosyltransferase involved in cell wall biosynthesis